MTTDSEVGFADVDAGVRRALASYCHALDDGRAADVVATFTPDGSIDIEGLGAHAGADELLAAYQGWTPQVPQRHMVVNTDITHWTQDVANATSDVVVIIGVKGQWRVQVVGRYRDELRRHEDRWLFHRRTATFETP